MLKIKTGKKSHLLKAVYIDNSTANWRGSYFIYYYDLLNHTFYIDDLPWIGTEYRTSAINIIERIATKIFYQEMNNLWDAVKKLQRKKEPQFYYFYKQKCTGLYIMDTVEFKILKDKKGNIVRFLNPTWESNSYEKIDSNTFKAG